MRDGVDVTEVIAGRYELGALIGTGGNGRVFSARDRVLDRVVAVKLVDAETVRHRDPAGRERFLDEARSSAGFSHPNAVAVFDAGEADGSLYLVMELVEGPTLADRLVDGGPLEPVVAVKVAADVLAALDAAHRAGIIHRDVKPANVLLDANGTAKLADFGIAKRLDSVATGLTNPGQFFGTPKYLAPEQVDGRTVSPATDVYATGVVLFEMLAGRPPFDEGQPMATAIAQRDAAVPDLRQIRPDAPETLIRIVETALRKEPDDRFVSAEAMRAALTAPLWPAPPAVASEPANAAVAVEPTVVLPPREVEKTSILSAPASVSTAAAAPQMVHLGGGSLRPRGGAGRVLAIGLAVVAVVALVLALALRDDADPLDAAATTLPGETLPGETVASPIVPGAPVDPAVTAVLATAPVITPLPILPSDVPMLIQALGPDPSFHGEAGPQLAEGLQKVVDRKGKKQRDEAEDLVEQIEEWVALEVLEPSIADLSIQLLQRLAEASEEDD